LLKDGTVLVTGGLDSNNQALASAELFDPTTDTFTPTTGAMETIRSGHTATLLSDGTVLVAGGSGGTTAELYDPTTGTFTGTGSMQIARAGHTATLLKDGTVLVTGGLNLRGHALAAAELYQ
jgi:WD40 repeat protein